MLLTSVLVSTVCFTGTHSGCSQAMKALYAHSPELQVIAKNIEDMGRRVLMNDEVIAYTVVPIYTLASGNTASFILYKNVSLDINYSNLFIFVRWSF